MSLKRIIKENFGVGRGRKADADRRGISKKAVSPDDEPMAGHDKTLGALYNAPQQTYSVSSWDTIYVPSIVKSFSEYDKDDIVGLSLAKLRSDNPIYPVKGYTEGNNLYITHFAELMMLIYGLNIMEIPYVELDGSEKDRYTDTPWTPVMEAEYEGGSQLPTKIKYMLSRRVSDNVEYITDPKEVNKRLDNLNIR